MNRPLSLALVLFLGMVGGTYASADTVLHPTLQKLEDLWQSTSQHVALGDLEGVHEDLADLQNFLDGEHEAAIGRSKKYLGNTLEKLKDVRRQLRKLSARNRANIEKVFGLADKALRAHIERQVRDATS